MNLALKGYNKELLGENVEVIAERLATEAELEVADQRIGFLEEQLGEYERALRTACEKYWRVKRDLVAMELRVDLYEKTAFVEYKKRKLELKDGL